jgi:hypothetical protein
VNVLIGLIFHLLAWFDVSAKPRAGEVIVFFMAFAFLGLPLCFAMILWGLLTDSSPAKSQSDAVS